MSLIIENLAWFSIQTANERHENICAGRLSNRYDVAASDYPTRIFYRELYDSFPDAHFILSVRKSPDVWVNSVEKYFNTIKSMNVDVDKKLSNYLRVNERIEQYFLSKPDAKYIKFVVDDESLKKEQLINGFLGIHSGAKFLKLNTSDR